MYKAERHSTVNLMVLRFHGGEIIKTNTCKSLVEAKKIEKRKVGKPYNRTHETKE
jgi:hypothetical protein